MSKTKVGVALTGSFCTFQKIFEVIEKLVKLGYEIYPVLSYHASEENTENSTDESEDENRALRYYFPFAMHRIVYSNEKLENFQKCKEPYNPYKHLKPKRSTPKQE